MTTATDKPRILIVEDQDDVRRMQKLALEARGYVADDVVGGPEALAYLKEKKPDLVLLDVSMPVMTGFEVLEAIRKDPATATLPVILLTAMGSEKDKEIGLGLGANAYVTKPCPPAVLREILSKFFEARPE